MILGLRAAVSNIVCNIGRRGSLYVLRYSLGVTASLYAACRALR